MTNMVVCCSRAWPVVIAAALAACAGGGDTAALAPDHPRHPRSLDPASCALDAYAPVAVQPHYERELMAKTPVQRLRGASVFIPARAGLTAEWLRVELAPHAGHAPGCALHVEGAEVMVASDGPGFRVTIRAGSEAAGREILRLARIDQAGG